MGGKDKQVVALLNLENMYYKTKLGIRLPRGITDFLFSNIGLKQGCNLSLIIFNLLINDINRILTTSKSPQYPTQC